MFETPEGAKTKAAPRPKRFYQKAESARAEDGFQVLLDGKVLKTAGRGALLVPTAKLADAIAAEWNSQGTEIITESMKQMQFACAALDYVAQYRADVEEETLGYGETDALCYQVEEPVALAELQKKEWFSQLLWAEKRYGARPVLTGGIMPAKQDERLMAGLHAEVSVLPLFDLTAFWLMTKITGSILLASAVRLGALTADEAFRLSRIEETYQNAQWGEDDEARERRESAASEMVELGRFLTLISPEKS